jgi:hypothetical protein
MCIIMSKPAGVRFPSIATLRNCWEHNPHGAGYAVADGEDVYIRKGFMTWDEFIGGINFDALIDRACVFHFRFATHGSTSPGNCHPFPVEGNLKRQKVRTDVAIAHNGIVRDVPITPSALKLWVSDVVAVSLVPSTNPGFHKIRADGVVGVNFAKICGLHSQFLMGTKHYFASYSTENPLMKYPLPSDTP